MRKLMLALLLVALALPVFTFAQEPIFSIKPGQKAIDVIPDTAQFFSKNFVKGRALLKDGRFGAMVLNYNRLFEEMMFVDEKNDTVSLSNPQDFVFFVIGNDTFYYSNDVYLRKVRSYGDLQLAERVFFITSNVKRQGPMGTTSTSTASDMINQHESIVGYRDMVFSQHIDLKQKTDYYIADDSNDFKLATKKQIQKMSRNKGRAKEYFKAYNASFVSREEIEKAMQYIVQ